MAERVCSNSLMDLSIIIVNYKTKAITGDCLKSIKASTDNLIKEVIVVDNGSADGSIEYLKSRFPWAKIVDAGGNVGFARGNNVGAKLARGKYLWLLNSDTIVKKTTIQDLFNAVKVNQAQISSCRLLNRDGSIQPQGGYLPALWRLAAWMLFIDDLPLIGRLIKPYHQNDLNWFRKNQQPGWLAGTALLVKKDLYQKLNGLDKDIFMYAEDVDFCLRASKLDIPVHYFSKPSLTHLGQASGSSKGAILGEYRGLKYLYKKHYSLLSQLTLKLLLKTGAMLRFTIFGIILGDKVRKDIYEEAFKLA